MEQRKTIRIFTDGACSGNKRNEGIGGWGICVDTKKCIYKYSGYEYSTTNNRMELLAVIKALEMISKNHHKKYDIFTLYKIFTDSNYVYSSIKDNWIANWQKHNWRSDRGSLISNVDLWREYLSLATEAEANNCKWDIVKVKGHSNIPLNEIADSLATGAVTKAKNKKEKNNLRR